MEWSDSIPNLIGAEPASITWWQMTIRAAVGFLFGLLLVRIFGQRAFGRQTVLDVILAIVVGSNLSRTMTASAPLWPTLAATTVAALLSGAYVPAPDETVVALVCGANVDPASVEEKTSVRSSRNCAVVSSCVPKVSCVLAPVARSILKILLLPLTRAR